MLMMYDNSQQIKFAYIMRNNLFFLVRIFAIRLKNPINYRSDEQHS